MTGPLYIAHVGLWIAVVVEGLAICVLLYRNSQLLKVAASGGTVGGHATGAKAPAFAAKDLRTGEIVSHSQLAGQRTFLLFVTPGCLDCQQLVAGIADEVAERDVFAGLVVYCDGANRGCAHAFPDIGTVPLLSKHDDNVQRLFRIRALPALVEVDHAWHIVAYSYPSTAQDVRAAAHVAGVQ